MSNLFYLIKLVLLFPACLIYSRRPGLRRSSIRLLHKTGRTRRRRNSFACRVVKNWNRLPFAVASVTEQLKFKQLLESLYSIFALIWSFWALCPFPIRKYIHTYSPFVALSIFVTLSIFRRLIKLLSSSHPLLSTHFLLYLRTL